VNQSSIRDLAAPEQIELLEWESGKVNQPGIGDPITGSENKGLEW
jgi:hypothetical protein